jgi:CelD/BcsL family acetyltransferase involved in cellulose biosynthesis
LDLKVVDQHTQLRESSLPSSLDKGAHASTLSVRAQWGTVELIDGIAEEWRQLCQQGPCNEPFFRPEWVAAAVRAFGSRQRLLLVTVWTGSHLRGVLPLLEKKGRASALTGTSLCSASLIPRFEFVHGTGPDVDDAIRATWQYLRELPGWDVIELINVPEGSAAERLLDTAKADGFPTCSHEYARSPYIDLAGQSPGADFSRFGRSSRFRYHLRQGWRELSKLGPLRLRRLEQVDPESLQLFYRMEESGWKGRKGTAIACGQEMRQFFDAIVRGAAEFGYLSMYFLDKGDTTIAAHLAFTCGGRYFPVKVAYDETFSSYGPGHLIIARVLEDCVARGLTEFDCLGDWTDAKAKWTDTVRQHNFCGIFRNTALGQILRAKTRWKYELRQTAFQVLRPAVRHARTYIAKFKRRSPGSSKGKQKNKPETMP